MLPLYLDHPNSRTQLRYPFLQEAFPDNSWAGRKASPRYLYTIIYSMLLFCFSASPNDYRSPCTVPKELGQCLIHSKCSVNVGGMNKGKEGTDHASRAGCHAAHLGFPGLACGVTAPYRCSSTHSSLSQVGCSLFSPRDNLEV